MEELTQKEIEEIRKDPDKADWSTIFWDNLSCHKKLSEDFIREFSDKVNWKYVSKHQKLSKSFIYEFYDKVDWEALYEKDYNFKDAPRHVKLYISLNHRYLLNFNHQEKKHETTSRNR